jgi:hypothetical protein
MKESIVYLIFIFTLSCNNTAQNDSNINISKIPAQLNADIVSGVNELKKYKKLINSTLNTNNKKEILSIGFPEVIRYNIYNDLIEFKTNELLYVRGGKSLSDFSIGLFQMKPSFIENLEYYVQKYNLEKYKYIINFNFIDIVGIRTERLKRLHSTKWQLQYLEVFWEVAHIIYSNINFINMNQRIEYYSTVYNCGFDKTNEFIIEMCGKKNFPYGKRYSGEQLSYSQFSTLFYSNYSKNFTN